MRLADCSILGGGFKIDMVETAKGCPEGCLHCGAYSKWTRKDFEVRALSRDQLVANLDREVFDLVLNMRFRLADFFAKTFTTDVNTEPLRSDSFVDLADLVYDLSSGGSQVACISHGVRVAKGERGDLLVERRMEQIVERLMNGRVPLFVVSLDTARSQGKISEEVNYRSYLRTFELLWPAIEQMKGNVTVSIQGHPDPANVLFVGKSEAIFNRIYAELKARGMDIGGMVHIDRGRAYAKLGRADENGVYSNGECPIIPDWDFVEGWKSNGYAWRGKVDFDGKVFIQKHEPLATYNTTVNGEWFEVEV